MNAEVPQTAFTNLLAASFVPRCPVWQSSHHTEHYTCFQLGPTLLPRSAGTIVDVLHHRGVFFTTQVTFCQLKEHRGYHPTGEIATACGKLMVRTSEWTWEHLRGLVSVV